MMNRPLFAAVAALSAAATLAFAETKPLDPSRPPERPAAGATSAPQTAKPADAQAQTEPAPPAEAATDPTPAKEIVRENDKAFENCLSTLNYLGTSFEEVAPITEAADSECGIARPIRVSEIVPGVTLQGGAVMRCDMARRLGLWTKNLLQPMALALPEPLKLTEMQLGSTYACRARRGTGQERPKISQHAVGNAIDIASFGFEDGSQIPVTPREDSGDQAESFQRAAQGTACIYFTTVLGPGSNAAHADHLHLDIIERKRGWRLCQ